MELFFAYGIKSDAIKISACFFSEAGAISFPVFSCKSDRSGQSLRLGCGCRSSFQPIPFDSRLSVFQSHLRLFSSVRPSGRTFHLPLCPLPLRCYSAFFPPRQHTGIEFRFVIPEVSFPPLSPNADLCTLRDCKIWKQIRSLLPICAAHCLKNRLHSQFLIVWFLRSFYYEGGFAVNVWRAFSNEKIFYLIVLYLLSFPKLWKQLSIIVFAILPEWRS